MSTAYVACNFTFTILARSLLIGVHVGRLWVCWELGMGYCFMSRGGVLRHFAFGVDLAVAWILGLVKELGKGSR